MRLWKTSVWHRQAEALDELGSDQSSGSGAALDHVVYGEASDRPWKEFAFLAFGSVFFGALLMFAVATMAQGPDATLRWENYQAWDTLAARPWGPMAALAALSIACQVGGRDAERMSQSPGPRGRGPRAEEGLARLEFFAFTAFLLAIPLAILAIAAVLDAIATPDSLLADTLLVVVTGVVMVVLADIPIKAQAGRRSRVRAESRIQEINFGLEHWDRGWARRIRWWHYVVQGLLAVAAITGLTALEVLILPGEAAGTHHVEAWVRFVLLLSIWVMFVYGMTAVVAGVLSEGQLILGAVTLVGALMACLLSCLIPVGAFGTMSATEHVTLSAPELMLVLFAGAQVGRPWRAETWRAPLAVVLVAPSLKRERGRISEKLARGFDGGKSSRIGWLRRATGRR